MNNYKVGRDFEEEALIYLQKIFKNVIWLSRDSCSTFDFRCDDTDGSILYGDAKVTSQGDKPTLNYRQRDADFVIAKVKGNIKLILKKDFNEQIYINKTVLASLYPSEELMSELKRLAKKDNRSLNNFILSVLTKYVRAKR